MYAADAWAPRPQRPPLPPVLEPFSRLPRWAQITFMVLGFVLFWPIGLAILAFMIWSGKMGACAKWKSDAAHTFGFGHMRSTGNQAFDDYRRATLERLAEESREFSTFVDRLRRAKDEEEFERFMAERRARPPGV